MRFTTLYSVCTKRFVQLDLLFLYICVTLYHNGKRFSVSLGHCFPAVSFMERGSDRIKKSSLRADSLISLQHLAKTDELLEKLSKYHWVWAA